MSAVITGGEATYSRMVRPADFENKSATVKFVITDDGNGTNGDAEGIVHAALQLAQHHVHAALGLKTTAPDANKPPAAKEAKSKPEKTKADLAAEVLAKAAGGMDVVTAQPAEKVVPTPPTDSAPVTAAIDDIGGELTGEAGPITDAHLQDAITKANAATDLKLTPKIKQLIATYAGEGKRSHQIPTEKRKAFVTELDALKNAHLATASL